MDASDFQNGLNLLSSIGSTFQKLVAVVTCSSSTTLREMWRNEGYDKLDIESTLKRSIGIMADKWEVWKKSMMKFNKIPNEYQQTFNDFLDESEEVESNIWSKTELIYDEASSANIFRVLNFFINERNDGKKDCVYTNIRLKFSLAQGTEIWTKGRSFVGGAYSDLKDKIVKTNPKLTQKSIEDLINIIRLLSFNFIGNSFGLDLKIPKI